MKSSITNIMIVMIVLVVLLSSEHTTSVSAVSVLDILKTATCVIGCGPRPVCTFNCAIQLASIPCGLAEDEEPGALAKMMCAAKCDRSSLAGLGCLTDCARGILPEADSQSPVFSTFDDTPVKDALCCVTACGRDNRSLSCLSDCGDDTLGDVKGCMDDCGFDLICLAKCSITPNREVAVASLPPPVASEIVAAEPETTAVTEEGRLSCIAKCGVTDFRCYQECRNPPTPPPTPVTTVPAPTPAPPVTTAVRSTLEENRLHSEAGWAVATCIEACQDSLRCIKGCSSASNTLLGEDTKAESLTASEGGEFLQCVDKCDEDEACLSGCDQAATTTATPTPVAVAPTPTPVDDLLVAEEVSAGAGLASSSLLLCTLAAIVVSIILA